MIVPLLVLRNCGAQEPECLHCSHSAVHDGSRQVSSEVHDHLHCFERVQLQVVKTIPESQLLNLLSVSRLVTILDEADRCGVVCELQELDRGVFGCVVIHVQGEEQWGENTALRSSSADRTSAGCVIVKFADDTTVIGLITDNDETGLQRGGEYPD